MSGDDKRGRRERQRSCHRLRIRGRSALRYCQKAIKYFLDPREGPIDPILPSQISPTWSWFRKVADNGGENFTPSPAGRVTVRTNHKKNTLVPASNTPRLTKRTKKKSPT